MDDISGTVFICDEPAQHKYLITYPGKLPAEGAARLQRMWVQFMASPDRAALVLEEGVDIRPLGPCYEWPDAAHCAA